MKEIKKLEDDIECDKCEEQATARIKTQSGEPLRLCQSHEEEFAENLREKIEEKFEGMSEEEIAKKVFQEGESLL